MNVIRVGIGIMLSSALVSMATAQQNLDPVFRVSSVTGECQISLPGQGNLIPIEEAKAYPYGSRIRTAGQSSLVLTISEGNEVRVLANADLVMNEDSSNKKIKNVELSDGEVEVELNQEFHAGGNALNVETAVATSAALGTQFRVASRMEQNLRIVIFRVIKGLIRVNGENFEVPEMKADDWLSLLSPADRSFLRLKNMKGAFNIRIKDQDMNDKILPTIEGTVLKIWQREIPETNERVVTSVLTSPEGEMIETITVTFGAGLKPMFNDAEWVSKLPADVDKEPKKGNPLPPEDIMDLLIRGVLDDVNVEFQRKSGGGYIPPRPPSPTPVGKR